MFSTVVGICFGDKIAPYFIDVGCQFMESSLPGTVGRMIGGAAGLKLLEWSSMQTQLGVGVGLAALFQSVKWGAVLAVGQLRSNQELSRRDLKIMAEAGFRMAFFYLPITYCLHGSSPLVASGVVCSYAITKFCPHPLFKIVSWALRE